MTRRPSRQRATIDFESLRSLRTRSYIRESTPRQAEADHYGPDLQRAGIRAFCERFGISAPGREYFDTASGRRVKGRLALQDALADAGQYDVLLVFHSSRSFRNRHDAAVYKRQFREAGVVMVFTEQQIISGNPGTNLQEGFHELIDEQRSEEQGRFIAGALRQKFERGGVNGRPPLGYRRFHGELGDPRNGSLVLDKDGQRTVRAIVDLYIGGRSMTEIAILLNARSDDTGELLHRTRLGRPLTKGSVEEVLRNRTYTGVTVWRPGTPDEEVRPGSHEAIVSDDEWARVEAIRRGRTNSSGRRSQSRVYPLSRVARCYVCGASFAGDTGGRERSRRLRHAASSACSAKRSHSADLVESQLGEVIETRLSLPANWELSALESIAGGSSDEVEADGETSRLEATRERLRKLYQWGDIEEAEYRRERERLGRQLLVLEAEREHAAVSNLEELGRAAELLQDLPRLWAHPGVTQDQRRDFANEAFESVRLDDAGIRAVEPRVPYRRLLRAAVEDGMEMVGATGFEPATSWPTVAIRPFSAVRNRPR